MRSVPYEGVTTKCVRAIKIFMSLAKYYYNAIQMYNKLY